MGQAQVALTAHISGVVCHPCARTSYSLYLLVKLDDSSISRSKDIIEAPKKLNGYCDMTMPPSGVICHP